VGERVAHLVEQQVRGIDGADAVDEAVVGLAVVGLGHQGPAAVAEAVDEHHLPGRDRAVEAAREVVARPGQELVPAGRLAQARLPHVAGDVELLVLDPVLPGHGGGVASRQALAVARQRVEALVKVRAHLLESGRAAPGRGTEDENAADVHVRGMVGVLELEERAVEGAQAL
jgi:hypothetical protein